MDEGAFLCNRAAIRASDVEAKHHGSDVVGVDDHRATLEALDVDIARGRHGSAQRADVVHLAISAVFILISSGAILFETSNIIRGGETNYIRATVSLYVSLYNIFVSLLSILGFASRD